MDKVTIMGIENWWPYPIEEYLVSSVDIADSESKTIVYYPYGYPTGEKGGKI